MPSLDSENEKPAGDATHVNHAEEAPPGGEPSEELTVKASVSVTNGEAEKAVPDPLQYQVETVDFPDSPQPTKRTKSKKIQDPLQVHSDDESEALASVAADMSANGNSHNSWASESLESTDEYFEDSLLHTSSSCRDMDLNWSSENDHSLNISSYPSSPSIKLENCSSPTRGSELTSLQTEQPPDVELLQKLKNCFDQEKIKDIYVLSGRLQDILTPVEIQEIVFNSDLYGDFIDDDMFEVLSAAYVELSSGFQRGGSIRDSRRKIRASLTHRTDLMDDIKIRAVFEYQKTPNKDSLVRQQKMQKPIVSVAPSTGDMRQFFEDNLVKGASIPQLIVQDNPSIKEEPETTILPKNEPSLETEVSSNNADVLGDSQNYSEPYSMPVIALNDTVMINRMVIDGEKEVKSEAPLLTEKNKFVPERPGTLLQDGTLKKKKIKVTPDILNSEESVKDEDIKSLSSLSNKSDADVTSPMEDLVTPDDIDTPDDMDESTLNGLGSYSEMIPELSAVEELEEERSWKTCQVGGSEQKIDLKVIEPYKKVFSHGGYLGPNRHAIIVFSACNLPDKSRIDYDYVMDNLFLYVLCTLDELVAEDYVLIYLHGATQRSNMPTFGWLKRCYQMIDRRLRKNLKGLYLVHPTFWLKTIVIMTKPFVSSKFSRKLQFVNTLKELSELIPMDQVCIPDKVKQVEFKLMIEERKRALKNRQKSYPEVYSTPRRPITGYN